LASHRRIAGHILQLLHLVRAAGNAAQFRFRKLDRGILASREQGIRRGGQRLIVIFGSGHGSLQRWGQILSLKLRGTERQILENYVRASFPSNSGKPARRICKKRYELRFSLREIYGTHQK
jgi:hypothetical protein